MGWGGGETMCANGVSSHCCGGRMCILNAYKTDWGGSEQLGETARARPLEAETQHASNTRLTGNCCVTCLELDVE